MEQIVLRRLSSSIDGGFPAASLADSAASLLLHSLVDVQQHRL